MAIIHRRSFVQRLGLGAGAVALSPIVNALVREARGETAARKRLLFVFDGNGFHHRISFPPPGLEARIAGRDAFETRDFSLPPAAAALEPFRNKLLMLDGTYNFQGPSLAAGHAKGYMTTTCVPHVGTAPGNISIDQFIGRGLVHQNPYAAVSLAATNSANGGLVNQVSAAGPGTPVPAISSPLAATTALFAPLSGDATGAALMSKRKRLIDVLREDVQKVSSAVSGRERLKLEQYVAALNDVDARQGKLEALKGAKAPVVGATGTLEQNLAAHFDVAAGALIAGVTQVVVITSPGTGAIWNSVSATDTHVLGHDDSASSAALRNRIHNLHAEQITRFLNKLQAMPEPGGGTMADNTVVFWGNHNAEGHHSNGYRYPAILIGTAGGAIKADGRLIKFGPKGTSGHHTLADVYCTLAHAMGVPTDSFGKGGNEEVHGAIPALM